MSRAGNPRTKAILAAYQDGQDLKVIAAEFGIWPQDVPRLARRHNIPLRRPHLSEAHRRGWQTKRRAVAHNTAASNVEPSLAADRDALLKLARLALENDGDADDRALIAAIEQWLERHNR